MFIQFREFLFISLIKNHTKQSLEVNPLYKYYTTVELSIIHLKVVRRKGKIKYIFSQGSTEIRQWPFNLGIYPMLIHKFTPSTYILQIVVEMFGHSTQ